MDPVVEFSGLILPRSLSKPAFHQHPFLFIKLIMLSLGNPDLRCCLFPDALTSLLSKRTFDHRSHFVFLFGQDLTYTRMYKVYTCVGIGV